MKQPTKKFIVNLLLLLVADIIIVFLGTFISPFNNLSLQEAKAMAWAIVIVNSITFLMNWVVFLKEIKEVKR